MRMILPLIRTGAGVPREPGADPERHGPRPRRRVGGVLGKFVSPPARTPSLNYGVAVLSTILALIPTLFLSDMAESRLVVFAVAVMVSAWYGGWKPGLAATSFALTVSAYYSLRGPHSPGEYRKAVAHLVLFFATAILICWFNAVLRSAQEGLRRSEVTFRSLVTLPSSASPVPSTDLYQTAAARIFCPSSSEWSRPCIAGPCASPGVRTDSIGWVV